MNGHSNGELPIFAPRFNLSMTLASGQVFHWLPDGDGFLGVIGNRPVRVEQQGECLWVTPNDAETRAAVAHYFALDHSLDEICATFPQDAAMQAALTYCDGLRLIRQPLWECTATFITSAMKQVKHISQMSHAIRQRFGTPVRWGNRTLHAYPAPETLARHANEAALRECGLGFRAGKLHAAAEAIASGAVDLQALEHEPDDTAVFHALCQLPGVGPKIAHCILLFAYGRYAAFPIDVWIERVLRHHYFPRRRKPLTQPQLQAFAAKYFGPYGGYAQQYLFHHARNQPRSLWKKK